MGELASVYYRSKYPDCYWISVSETGEHGGSHYFYFKFDFVLPCFNNCGISYNTANTFCLNLELYTDNSVSEVYVNGKPQSTRLGNMPLPNPFSPGINHTQSTVQQVQLCSDWVAGENSLIIEVASSATVVGLLVQKAVTPKPPPSSDTIPAAICSGETYLFAGQTLTQSGYYYNNFTTPGGCDSSVILDLFVRPRAGSRIDTSICFGQSVYGYAQTGLYTDTFDVAGNCDSIRILNLVVNGPPQPDLGPDILICEGDSILISPGIFDNYLWQNGSSSPAIYVSRPGTYSVTVTNACTSASDQITVRAGVCDLEFPNAFTPNDDGLNDFFGILTSKQLTEYHLQVYNRLGEKVFESYSVNEKWNGTFKNKNQAAGNYSWYFTYRENGKLMGKKGVVMLIR